MAPKPSYKELLQQVADLDKELKKERQKNCELRESEERYRLLADNANDIIVLLDLNLTFKYVSPSIERILGYAPDEVIGLHLQKIIKKGSLSYALNVLLEEYAYEKIGDTDPFRSRTLSLEIYRKDGTKIWIEGAMGFLKDSNGEPSKIICIARNITERKRAEKQIECLNSIKEQLLNSENLNIKLHRITKGIVEILNVDLVQIWITKPGDLCDSSCVHKKEKKWELVCNKEKHCLHLMANGGYTVQKNLENQRVPMGKYKIGRLFTDDESKFITSDITDARNIYNHHLLKEKKFASFAGYRLLSSAGKTIGVLSLLSKLPISSNNDGLLESLANTTAQVIQTSMAEEELKRHRDHLEELVKERTINLEEANIALKVLLKERAKDKLSLEEKMLFNVKNIILPYIEKLNNSGLNAAQSAYLNVLESNLNDITSQFSYSLSGKYLNLTPSEIQIVNLIKQNKTTKEIAKLLNLSTSTIDSHRKNIRRKIGITNKKANLITHLRIFQEW